MSDSKIKSHGYRKGDGDLSGTKYHRFLLYFIIITNLTSISCNGQEELVNYSGSTLDSRIKIPKGYERIDVKAGSFAEWLRKLPVKPGKGTVHLYNGLPKFRQNDHVSILDFDTGDKDIQQCADSVLRLRAEYLWAKKRYNDLKFRYTSGDISSWNRWKQGWRPVVKGNNVSWIKSNTLDDTYENFRKWLENLFYYASTISISRDFPKVNNINDIQPGDFFVEAGSPGHAVLVVDVAVNNSSGERIFLLVQGYMPAQEIHILVNKLNMELNPWYSSELPGMLETPYWDFKTEHLRRLGE
jgi:hypothetical protein